MRRAAQRVGVAIALEKTAPRYRRQLRIDVEARRQLGVTQLQRRVGLCAVNLGQRGLIDGSHRFRDRGADAVIVVRLAGEAGGAPGGAPRYVAPFGAPLPDACE